MPDSPVCRTYYDSRRQLRQHFRRLARRMPPRTTSRAAFSAWTRRARAKLAELLGLDRMTAAPAAPRRTETVDCGDVIRERWLIRTEPNVTMPFYLLRPKGRRGALPAVICPHGHSGGGKAAVAGVGGDAAVEEAVRTFNYDYGRQLARAGMLAFCPDARGFGERQEPEMRHNVIASSCHLLQVMGAPLGIPVAGMWVFDLMRLMDYVRTRKDVIGGRVGCAGLSGGGLQTLFFAAVDPRVCCAVVSGYFYGVRQSLLDLPTNCDCNVIPRLWESFDMGDVGALVAPRPLLIETGDADPLNGATGIRNVRSQLAVARKAYRLLGAGGRLRHHVFAGEHRWHGGQAVPWLHRWLTEA